MVKLFINRKFEVIYVTQSYCIKEIRLPFKKVKNALTLKVINDFLLK